MEQVESQTYINDIVQGTSLCLRHVEGLAVGRADDGTHAVYTSRKSARNSLGQLSVGNWRGDGGEEGEFLHKMVSMRASQTVE
jgi:hypothetical protein